MFVYCLLKGALKMQESGDSQDSGAGAFSKVWEMVIALARLGRKQLNVERWWQNQLENASGERTDKSCGLNWVEKYALVDAGEVVHPGLVRGVERIKSLEANGPIR